MTNKMSAEGAPKLLMQMVRLAPEILIGALLLIGVCDAAYASQPQIRAISSTNAVELRRPGELVRVPQRTVLIRSVNANSDAVMATNQPLRVADPPRPTQVDYEAIQQADLQAQLVSRFKSMAGNAAGASQSRPSATGARALASITPARPVAGYRTHTYKPVPVKRLFSLSTYQQQIQQASSIHGVDEALVRAIIHAESAYNPKARSHVGAGGLMQLMPATATRFGVTNRFDPNQNINGGTRYLAWLLKRYRGNVTLASAAYNAGEGAVDKYRGVPPYRETINYVQKVGSLLTQYRRAMTGVFDGSMASLSASSVTTAYQPAYTSSLRTISSP